LDGNRVTSWFSASPPVITAGLSIQSIPAAVSGQSKVTPTPPDLARVTAFGIVKGQFPMSPRSSVSTPDWLRFLVQQLGPGILIAAACAWGLVRVYGDLTSRNEAFILLIRAEIESSQRVASALERVSSRLDAIDSRLAGARASSPPEN
jgi:hypothetical protein